MSTLSLAENAVGRLDGAIRTGSHEQADAEIENLADVLVGALMLGDHGVASGLYPLVERLYSCVRARDDLADWGKIVSGQLRTLTTVASVAARKRRIADKQKLAEDSKYYPLLVVLCEANRPLTNQEVAKNLGVTEETVARHIPRLREAGLVVSKQRWRSINNELSSEGRELIRELRARDRRPASEVLGSYAHELENITRGLATIVGSEPVKHQLDGKTALTASVAEEPARAIAQLMQSHQQIGLQMTREPSQGVSVTLTTA